MIEAMGSRIPLPRWLTRSFGVALLLLALTLLWVFVRITLVIVGRGDLLPQHDPIVWPWLPFITGVYFLTKLIGGRYVRRQQKLNGS